jgi:mono/diheme cytochrome c family protein
VSAGATLPAVLLLTALAACAERDASSDAPPPLPPTPTALARGESLYVASCASCHGVGAAGTAQGPPLAHMIYEPSHHGDASFRLAAQRGVRAHHWRFGDMPPQPGVSPAMVDEIVAYVRWVQRQRGIR